MTQSAEIIIDEGDARIEVHLHGETVWLTQAQMADLFSVRKAAISRHLKSIFASGELDMVATVSILETVQTEGRRSVKRQVEYLNPQTSINLR
jgi:hypothetical protein